MDTNNNRMHWNTRELTTNKTETKCAVRQHSCEWDIGKISATRQMANMDDCVVMLCESSLEITGLEN
jgi:hypothetical protein